MIEEPIHRCYGCDRELPAADAICPDCEEALGSYLDDGDDDALFAT